jgi:hypothetical protein
MEEKIIITKADMLHEGKFIVIGGGEESVTLVPIVRQGEPLWGTEEQRKRLEQDPEAAGYYWTKWPSTEKWCLTWRGYAYRTRDGLTGGH